MYHALPQLLQDVAVPVLPVGFGPTIPVGASESVRVVSGSEWKRGDSNTGFRSASAAQQEQCTRLRLRLCSAGARRMHETLHGTTPPTVVCRQSCRPD